MCLANVLPTRKQIAIIAALAEGSSIRSIERITGVHRDTIMRPIKSAQDAVRAAIVQEFRNLEPAE
jgi:transposase-like protein